jgi:hypothetical protein
MTLPSSPTDNLIGTLHGIEYKYNLSKSAWQRQVSNANVTGSGTLTTVTSSPPVQVPYGVNIWMNDANGEYRLFSQSSNSWISFGSGITGATGATGILGECIGSSGATGSTGLTNEIIHDLPIWSTSPSLPQVIAESAVNIQITAANAVSYLMSDRGTLPPMMDVTAYGHLVGTPTDDYTAAVLLTYHFSVISANDTRQVSESSTFNVSIRASAGRYWNERAALPSLDLHFKPMSLCYAAGIFMLGGETGQIAMSGDGINWTRGGTLRPNGSYSVPWGGAPMRSVVYAANTGEFINSAGYYSNDGGNTWRGRFASGGPVFYIEATGALFSFTTNGHIRVSFDSGISWSAWKVLFANRQVLGVSYGGDGVYLALGSSSGATSTDGINWTVNPVPVAPPAHYYIMRNAIWNPDRNEFLGFVFLVGTYPSIWRSTDGFNWTMLTNTIAFPSMYLREPKIIWTGSKYILTNNVNVFLSPDGITWTIRPYTTSLNSYTDIVWNGTSLLIVGHPYVQAGVLTWTSPTY